MTITYLFLEINSGKIIVIGYLLVFIILIFFRNLRIIFFTGAIILFAYWILLSNYLKEGILNPSSDFILLLAGMALALFIAHNSKKINHILLETQDELETTGLALEIKVQARTKELNDLANELDSQVKQKTEELQKKINDLERFNSLAIGRELKMISLKKEIKDLKATLNQLQNKNGGGN